MGKAKKEQQAKVCARCGAAFMPRNSAQVYCTLSCANAMESDRRRKGLSLDVTRKCHDCGRPTTDYRCPNCRQRFLAKHGIHLSSVDASDAYGEYVL